MYNFVRVGMERERERSKKEKTTKKLNHSEIDMFSHAYTA